MLDTIKSNAEISKILTYGKRYTTSALTLFIVPNLKHDLYGRAAFIAGKKYGNAVWRNTAKRRMRAIYRDLGGPWFEIDIIFLAKRKINSISYSKVLNECRITIHRAIQEYIENR